MRHFGIVVTACSLLSVAGCHLIYPFDIVGGDAGGGDVAGADAGYDVGERDLAREGPPGGPDAAKDTFAKDRALDVPAPDLPSPDLPPPDLNAPDTKTVSMPCVTGASGLQSYGDPKMALCSYGTFFSQCDASKYCDAKKGWKVCTAAQYQARGGKITVPVTSAWLAACVRFGGSATAPGNTPCPTCALLSDTSAIDVNFDCTAAWSLPSASAYVGVRTYGQCLRVGVNQAKHEAYWRAEGAGPPYTFKAVVCCLP